MIRHFCHFKMCAQNGPLIKSYVPTVSGLVSLINQKKGLIETAEQ